MKRNLTVCILSLLSIVILVGCERTVSELPKEKADAIVTNYLSANELTDIPGSETYTLSNNNTMATVSQSSLTISMSTNKAVPTMAKSIVYGYYMDYSICMRLQDLLKEDGVYKVTTISDDGIHLYNTTTKNQQVVTLDELNNAN
jgi:hypothetical protein